MYRAAMLVHWIRPLRRALPRQVLGLAPVVSVVPVVASEAACGISSLVCSIRRNRNLFGGALSGEIANAAVIRTMGRMTSAAATENLPTSRSTSRVPRAATRRRLPRPWRPLPPRPRSSMPAESRRRAHRCQRVRRPARTRIRSRRSRLWACLICLISSSWPVAVWITLIPASASRMTTMTMAAVLAVRTGLACRPNNQGRITTFHGFIDDPAPMSSCSCTRGRWREGRQGSLFPALFPARRTRRQVQSQLCTTQLSALGALRPRCRYRPFPAVSVVEETRPVVLVTAGAILAPPVTHPKRPTTQMAVGNQFIPRPRPTPGWMTPLYFLLRRRLRRLSLHPVRAAILLCGESYEMSAFRGASRVKVQRMAVPAEGGNLPRTSVK